MKSKFHIIGGGINGIISALYVKKKNKNYEVYLHESSSELGGKLLGFDYINNGIYFDSGTHIFQESGNVFLDQLILESLAENQIIFYPPRKGDLIGSIQNNKLSESSHFIDIRGNFKEVNEVNKHIESLDSPIGPIDIFASVSDQMKDRFGANFRDNYEKIFSFLFKQNSSELSAICLPFVGSTRIVLDDYSKWILRSNDCVYRSIIGVPETLKLPIKYSHQLKSFYPKEKGTKSLILGLINLLEKYKIIVIKSSKVQYVNHKSKEINSQVKDKLMSFKYDKVLISSGVISASKILKENISLDLIPPMRTTYFNIELQDNTLKDMFYFYNFDQEENFYRVTNYRAFSRKNNDTRITIECFKCELNLNEQVTKILNYLKKLGFIKNTKIKQLFIEDQPYGFPVLTLSNLSKIKILNDNLKAKSFDDLEITGLGTGVFNFFQNEIILNSLKKLDKLLDKSNTI